MAHKLWAKSALLAEGWADSVEISIDQAGNIEQILTDKAYQQKTDVNQLLRVVVINIKRSKLIFTIIRASVWQPKNVRNSQILLQIWKVFHMEAKIPVGLLAWKASKQSVFIRWVHWLHWLLGIFA